ncbi:MAG: glycosyltransferase family 4 protein [Zetaproteobacteria bacterium]|nr:glycosyltransferase family 4 protein [Zetaproteobacteria bacterium]
MISIIVAFVISMLLCYWLKSSGLATCFRDEPNGRSLHQAVVPTIGGLAIVSGIAVGWSLCEVFYVELIWVISAIAVVMLISVLDDLREVSPLLRIFFHIVAAIILVLGLMPQESFLIFFFIFSSVWMINLYNFMDGMDGFAGGMAFVGFLFVALAGWLSGHEYYALYALIIVASVTGFLLFNLPPAKIFMGDVGSTSLGVLVAAFSLWGIHDQIFPIWFPILTFSPFIMDATVTLLRRTVNRERIWEAHCTHYYQRLVKLGWGHKKTVLIEYAVMFAAGISSLVLLMLDSDMLMIVVFSLWGIFYFWVDVVVRKLECKAP